MPRALLVLPACLVLLLPQPAGAVPQQVAHQGELYDADGPVTDSVNFTFRLFDAETDGSEVWLEDRTIDVVDGLYSVLLGAETPIAQVLAEEPALWLEITVDGGDPLLPRQPLGSAPYAIVADTAVNVDGGTVNASSVSVNSSAIIDSGGNWVGGVGSIGWAAIDGAPVDADTLGGLSCADGDRAVWNDGLGQWECGSATVELDRLDVAGATTGDVLTFDGFSAAWEETAAAGGCNLAAVSDRVASLTCGATTARLRIPGEYIAVAGYQDTVRLRADGTVTLIGAMQVGAPTGTYVGLSRGNSSYYCAIDAAGVLSCQGSIHAYAYSAGPGGSFVDVACREDGANGHCCGIQTGGLATCWDFRDPGYAPSPSGSGYVQIASSYHGACARSTGGTVSCWNSPASGSDLAGNTPSLSGITQVTSSGDSFSAVDASGVVTFWADYSGSLSTSSIPAGNYVASTHAGTPTFIRDDGLAVYNSTPPGYVEGTFNAAGAAVLVRDDGTLARIDPTLMAPVD